MQIEELRSKYRELILALARKYHAENVRVFGSVARGEKNARDVDILVRFTPGASLLDEAGLDRELKQLLGQPVDVIGDDAIRDEFRPFILNEAVPFCKPMPDKINPDLVRLKDMLTAIGDIETFMQKSSLSDRMALMAIAYEIAIIGEAANNLSAAIKESHAYIPWGDIIGMRHRIIHHYGKINIDRLREVVDKHLPVLKRQVQEIAERLKP